MKRQNSAASSSTASTKPAASQGAKRSALGEVTNAGKAKAFNGVNGKDGKEKEKDAKPLAGREDGAAARPSITRRVTRQSLALSQSDKGTVKGTEKPKRKPALPSLRPAASSHASSKDPLVEVLINGRDLNSQPVGPVKKKRRTSTPPVEIPDGAAVDDIEDEGLYDEDGQEVELSSDKIVHLRSPKRKRAKDHGWTDLDKEDEGDPTMVSEYVVDAFNYMLELEDKTMPSATYMEDIQSEVQWGMRTILMDWLIEVHQKFRLLPETLFITVNLIDRFLSLRVVSLVKLQLVGLTALFIAAKYEEVISPSVSHFLHMTEGAYTLDELLKAERYLLSSINFDMSYPNPLHFLRRISKADGYDIQTRTVAKFLIEMACVEPKLIKYKPSRVAAAAMWLARLCLDREEWTPNLVHYSGYSVKEILEPAQIMLDYMLEEDVNTSTAFYKKYAGKKHMKSSVFFHTWAMRKWPGSVDGTSRFIGRELSLEVKKGELTSSSEEYASEA